LVFLLFLISILKFSISFLSSGISTSYSRVKGFLLKGSV
jgi:hypothetical protein